MRSAITISDLRIAAASSQDQESGLLAYVSFTINSGVRLDGITLRRTEKGRLYLAFPARHDSQGREHPYILPMDGTARMNLERQVFRTLGLPQESAP